MAEGLFLGFSVPDGEKVSIPLHHLIITGLTQLSGKTTTLEALITRSGLKGIVFRTKRGEIGFENANRVPLYFRERSDWEYVSSLLEARMRERMKFERGWIIQACKGANTLRDVYSNIQRILSNPRLRDFARKIYTELSAYFELIIPEIEKLDLTTTLELKDGINVMDLVDVPEEVQLLIIRSVLDYIYIRERNVIVVIPEAWKSLPEHRSSPVKRVVEHLIREGAIIGNYVFLDSQDLAGVDKRPLKSIDNWLLGKQREINEVIHTLKQIPLPSSQKPPPEVIMGLPLGHFVVCCSSFTKLVYALPLGIDEEIGREVAMGKRSPEEVKAILEKSRLKEDEDLVWKEKFEEEKRKREQFQAVIEGLRSDLEKINSENRQLLEEIENKNGEIEELKDQLEKYRNLQTALSQVIPIEKVLPATKIDLEHRELEVEISHTEETVEMSTKTGLGKILYVAIETLPKNGFTEKELSDALDERGWHTPHSTLAPNLAQLCKQGYLIKITDQKPTKYKLPTLLKIKIQKEE